MGIKEYLKDVATLEGQLYTQNQLFWKLKNQADVLGIANNYEKPVMQEYSIGDFLATMLFLLPKCAIASAIITFLFLDKGWSFFFICSFFLSFLISFGLAVTVLSSNKCEYEAALTQYNNAVAEDQNRVQNELVQKARLQREYEAVGKNWNNTKKLLADAYTLGLIHPAYQNDMVAVCTIYDYLDKGICDTLTGPTGAYARYENDVKMGIIISKLDIIISKLDEIISNQYTIANMMNEANQTLRRIEESNDRIMRSASRIEENSEVTAYNTQCTAQSSIVMEHLMMYDHLRK